MTDECGFDASVAVAISGPGVVPESIVAATQLEATRAWRAGDEYSGKRGQSLRKHQGLWALDRAGDDVSRLVQDLVFLVEPRTVLMRESAAACGAEVTFSIAWHPLGPRMSFVLRADLLLRASAFSDVFEFYFFGMRGDDAGAATSENQSDQAILELPTREDRQQGSQAELPDESADVEPAPSRPTYRAEGATVSEAALRLLEQISSATECERVDAASELLVRWVPDGGVGGYSMPSTTIAGLCACANLIRFSFL